ncbi:MAG: response regulator [Phenylobacterium sp.]|nr:MAG: response regulator [Phenylobacterium sp.]
MSRVRTDRALYALIAGFAALVLAVAASIGLAQRQQHAFAMVTHTLEVQKRVAAALSALQDAETGERGFLLTGRPEFLQPYDAANTRMGRELDGLDAAIADNPRQHAAASRLRNLAAARQAVLRDSIARYRQGDLAGATDLGKLAQGKALMDSARVVVAGMQAEERGLLAERQQGLQTQTLLITIILTLSAIATLLLGGFVIRDARRRLAAAVEVGDALALSNQQLKAEAKSREAAEAQVRQMQKMEAVGQLTGGIAHDFNNMLAIVLGSLDLAKRRLGSDPQRVEACLDNAIEGTQRAAQLTGRLLAFSRQQPLEPRPLDVNKLVGGMSELLRRTIGEHLRVETVLAGGLWRTYADPTQLESAIINLCVNARDAMPDGGQLTIETSNAHLDDAYAAAHSEVTAGQYVMISVSDTGTGMPAEVVERAFDPFYTTKGVGRGTGLGLSQVHGFVKQSGGHVKIYSEAGVGTSVKIYLLRYFGADATGDHGPDPVAAAPRSNGEEIVLVVEDDTRVRHLSVDALRELGYTVVQAADASQALAVLTMQPQIDLLFTDVVMPDMNGRLLADRARETRPDLKVLYTTGYTRNAIVHNGVLDPDVALLSKPFTIEQLAVKVRQVIDGQPAHRPEPSETT